VGLNLQYNKGQTPISEEEKEDILLPNISTRGELDEFEQANIEKAIEWSMKNSFSIRIIFAMVFFFGILLYHSAAIAWDGSTHAYVAEEGLDQGDTCSYWARIGAIAPDFAWYLRDVGLIDQEDAIDLHDNFLNYVYVRNFEYRCFKDGAGTHLCADPIADETLVEWIASFKSLIGAPRELNILVLHLALEFAVGH